MNEQRTRLVLEAQLREAVSVPALMGAPVGDTVREVEVVALRSGMSKNGYLYSPTIVAALVPLLEGAQAFADHPGPQDRPERSVRDLVGFYRSARLEQERRPTGQPGEARAVATLHVLEPAGWLWSLICEALDQGMAGLVGLSIDLDGLVEARRDEASGRVVNVVTRIVRLNSCDVVTKPSAGGAILGLTHQPAGQGAGAVAGAASERLAIRARAAVTAPQLDGPAGTQAVQGRAGWKPALRAKMPAEMPPMNYSNGGTAEMARKVGVTEAARRQRQKAGAIYRIREEGNWPDGPVLERADVGGNVLAQGGADAQDDVMQIAALHEDARRALEAARRAQRLAECELTLGRHLRESHLPEPVIVKLRRRFEGRVFEAAELERAISDERETLAALAGLGLIREMGYEKAQTSQMITEAEKIQAAFDRMFDLEVDARFAGVRAFGSIREAYARVSGDPSVRGISGYSTLGQVQVDERAPIARITESDMTTANFSYLLGVSMNKRLLHDYQAWPAEWRRFCTEVPIKDFKQQTRVRLGAFGSLSTVAEDTPYTTITLSDSAASYSATKRGNIVTVSRETIINDDLHAIKQIPTKLATAAAYTLAEFVYSFLSGNGNIYDGNPLFDATNHKNLGTAALASSAMQAGVTAMREQTNYAGKRIGLRPKFLIVPPELEFTGLVLVKSAGVPGSNNNDINPMMGYTQLIVSPQLPAAGTPSNSSWYLAADPAEVDTIEIGFIGGQVNPAMFIQDQPLYGLNFTQDAISYKVRHEYGGAVMDWRGLYRGI